MNGVEAGGSRVTEIRYLNRSGLARKDEQPIARSVQGQIDQDIDTIGADRCGGRRVLQGRDIPPAVHFATEGLGHGIGLRNIGVAKHFAARLIARLEERKQGSAGDMLAKIGRNEADAQTASG